VRNLRRLFAAAAIFCGAGICLAGCFGSTSSGSDSETHFSCMSDLDCTARVPNSICVQHTCRIQSDRNSELVDANDAGPSGVGPVHLHAADAGPSLQPLAEGGASSPDAGGPWGKPLAAPITISGTISLDTGYSLPEGALSLALVWYQGLSYLADPECPLGEIFDRSFVVQPVDSAVVTPSGYTFQISQTPPYAAFGHPSQFDGGNVAVAMVFIYRDLNQNGALDFATVSTPSSDEIVGTSAPYDAQHLDYWPNADSYDITYSDRFLGQYGPPFVAGYGISHVRTDATENTPGAGGDDLPLDTDVHIVLGDRLRIQKLICGNELCLQVQLPFTCPDRIDALPTGGETMCFPKTSTGGPTFVWSETICDGCRCRGKECDYFVDPVNGPPPGWPCGSP